MARFDVAIIGAGASGTLLAVQLLRQAAGPLRIALIERSPAVGRGVAYATNSRAHRLNVPAGRMGGLPEDPAGFHRWLQAGARPEAGPGEFLPRGLYAEYLQALLVEARRAARAGVELSVHAGEAVAIATAEAGGYAIAQAAGEPLEAERVVLALGNFPPVLPAGLPASLAQSPHLVRDPWAPGAFAGVPPDAPLLLIGSGLTALDGVLALREGGQAGTLHLLSRHGLLPRAHAPADPVEALDLAGIERVSGLVERVRAAIAAGQAWRAVIDSLRAQTPALWARLSPAERRRFMRHLRAYWEVHRHRVAPDVAEAVERERAAGGVVVHAGRLRAAAETPDGLTLALAPRHGGATETLAVARVINCSGPASDYPAIDHPLVVDLLARGWARPDALKLGLDSTAAGAVVNAAGALQPGLFTIGPPRRGALWESTAIPEIRSQAHELAGVLLAAIAR